MIRSGYITAALIFAAGLVLFLGPVSADAQVPQKRLEIRRNGGIHGAIVLNQFVPNEPDRPPGENNLFVTNRQMTRALRQAEGLFKNQEYADGILVLQKLILDSAEDFLFYPDDQERSSFRSHKTEALNMLGDLPAEGLAVYEREYGPTARHRFGEAVAARDIAAVEEVARRFFHTGAGAEATFWLGSHHLDHGNMLAAAMHFDRLRMHSRHANQWEPMLTLKAAVCWEQSGFPQKSTKTLLGLRAVARGGRIELGGRSVPLFRDNSEARNWLLKILKQPRGLFSPEEMQWAMFRGNLQRNASSPPASPVWDSHWYRNTVRSEQATPPGQAEYVEAQLAALEANARRNKQITLPAVHPLIVGETVVFRTLRNLRAVHLQTGELLWESVQSDPAFETVLERDENDTLARGSSRTPQQQFLMQRAWNDLTAGTVSSDGTFLYVLEELDYLRHVLHPIRVSGENSLLQKYNKLMAVELESGKLKWEVGGSAMEQSLPLSGAFFLGPPIPLGRNLFVLAEIRGEIRLVELQTEQNTTDSHGGKQFNVKPVWSQTLLQPQGSVQHEPRRRLAGLSPSFDSGILVCPTAAGAVVAVDLSRKLLLWGYAYKNKGADSFEHRQIQMRFGFESGSYLMPYDMNEDRWVDSAVTIADGKVLLTPSDSDELHCLNLVDGTLLWKKPRGEGLYLAGVYDGKAVVVGRSKIEAWNLTDGSRAWKEPASIPMPSGRGFRADQFYCVPLSTAEIATVDLATGRIPARSKSRNGHVPGNLVSSRGVIVSQTTGSIVGYKSLSELNEAVGNALQKNPQDPDALALRGEMKLHRGDENGGLADLTRAISIKPDARAQNVMAATLLEGLHRDFKKYKSSTEQIRKLIVDPEQQATFLRLYAEGLEEIGQHREAFTEYLRLADSGRDASHLKDVSNLLAVRSHLFFQPRLEKIYNAASPADRAVMDRELAAHLIQAAEEEGPEPLRRFVHAFAPFPVAEEAQRILADRLDEKQQALELELLLLRLRNSEDVSRAGFATARLAELLIDHDRHEDALIFVTELDERFENVTCRDEKTGSRLAAEWRENETIAKLLAVDGAWPDRRIEAVYEPLKKPQVRRNIVPMAGDSALFFENWSFELDQSSRVLFHAGDRYGREQWRISTAPVNNQQMTFYGNYVRTRGHLMAAVFGNYFVVLDTLTPGGAPKILWRADLFDADFAELAGNRLQPRPVPLPNGQFRMEVADSYGRLFGKVGPIADDLLYYQAGGTLYAADPLTAETIWKRKDIPYGSDVVLTGNVLAVCANDSTQALLLRANSGEEIGRRSLPATDERLLLDGRHVVSWKRQEDKRVLAVSDLHSNRRIWSREFSGLALVRLVDHEEVAVMEPDGRFLVLSVADGKETLKAAIEPARRVSRILVRRTPDRYVLLSYASDPQPATFNVQGVRYGNFLVNGNAFGFDRKTGKLVWATKIEHQAFETAQPDHLPILVFCSYSFPTDRRSRITGQMQFRVSILDTRNGEMLFDSPTNEPATQFRLKINPEAKSIDVIFQRSAVSLATTDKPLNPPAKLENTKGE